MYQYFLKILEVKGLDNMFICLFNSLFQKIRIYHTMDLIYKLSKNICVFKYKVKPDYLKEKYSLLLNFNEKFVIIAYNLKHLLFIIKTTKFLIH